MFFSKWNIGLEIQPHQMIAVAAQKKRYGWQLRGWWQIAFPHPVYNQQGLSSSDSLIQTLTQWRKSLPRNLSIRLTLPNHLILQQTLTLPEQLTTQQDLQWYVEASVDKVFPLSLNELTIDYRPYHKNSGNIVLVTATKRAQLTQWINALHAANLTPDIIDIEASILHSLAGKAGLARKTLLLHRAPQYDLLISPHEHDFYFEQLPHHPVMTTETKSLLLEHYQQATQQSAQHISLSGDISTYTTDENIHYWSPFTAIRQLTAPLPHNLALFSISCGLAIREDDHDTNQSISLAN